MPRGTAFFHTTGEKSGLEAYLGLPGHDYADILARRFNHAPPADIPPSLRASLAAFYRPYNVRLQERLGRDLHWD